MRAQRSSFVLATLLVVAPTISSGAPEWVTPETAEKLSPGLRVDVQAIIADIAHMVFSLPSPQATSRAAHVPAAVLMWDKWPGKSLAPRATTDGKRTVWQFRFSAHRDSADRMSIMVAAQDTLGIRLSDWVSLDKPIAVRLTIPKASYAVGDTIPARIVLRANERIDLLQGDSCATTHNILQGGQVVAHDSEGYCNDSAVIYSMWPDDERAFNRYIQTHMLAPGEYVIEVCFRNCDRGLSDTAAVTLVP